MTPIAKTQAAVLFELGVPLQLVELDIPLLKQGQVLVQVHYSGVCHSQLNEVRGLKGPDRFLPHTLGHEGAGTVVAVGAGVGKAKPGDRVVLSWLKGSGADVPSTIYAGAHGAINSGAISTFMTHTVASENRVTVIPDDVPMSIAALLGCAVPTGAGVIFNASGLRAGGSVAIFGVGGIGLSAVMGAHALGASAIVAVDIVAAKLDKAVELGATHIVDASRDDVVAAVRNVTAGKGVDVALECSGAVVAMDAAFQSVKAAGGLCIVAGNPPLNEAMRVNPYDLIGGRRLHGTWGGETNPDTDIGRYVAMFRDGRLPLGRLGVREYALAEINRALDDLAAGRLTRALIRMTDAAAP